MNPRPPGRKPSWWPQIKSGLNTAVRSGWDIGILYLRDPNKIKMWKIKFKTAQPLDSSTFKKSFFFLFFFLHRPLISSSLFTFNTIPSLRTSNNHNRWTISLWHTKRMYEQLQMFQKISLKDFLYLGPQNNHDEYFTAKIMAARKITLIIITLRKFHKVLVPGDTLATISEAVPINLRTIFITDRSGNRVF
jgi:hypothetical protein